MSEKNVTGAVQAAENLKPKESTEETFSAGVAGRVHSLMQSQKQDSARALVNTTAPAPINRRERACRSGTTRTMISSGRPVGDQSKV